jgi:hypothetical protein
MIVTANASTPSFSIRISGGFTGAMYREIAYESDHIAPIFGAGIGYNFSNRHTLFLDAEVAKRTAELPTYLDITSRTITYYPISLGYRYSLVVPSRSFSPYASIAVTNGISVYKQSIDSTGDSQWRPGLIVGTGCSVRLNSRMQLSGNLQFRYLHDRISHYSYSATGRPDTQQNQGGQIVTPGEGGNFDSRPRIGGVEVKLILEFRL